MKRNAKLIKPIPMEPPTEPAIKAEVLLLACLIGEFFKQRRNEKGYTSYESFAFDHDLARVQYWRVEEGKSNFTLRTIIRLLLLYGVTLETFLYEMWLSVKKHNGN